MEQTHEDNHISECVLAPWPVASTPIRHRSAPLQAKPSLPFVDGPLAWVAREGSSPPHSECVGGGFCPGKDQLGTCDGGLAAGSLLGTTIYSLRFIQERGTKPLIHHPFLKSNDLQATRTARSQQGLLPLTSRQQQGPLWRPAPARPVSMPCTMKPTETQLASPLSWVPGVANVLP